MDEQAFEKIATATLEQIETALEKTGLDLDIEQKPGGVLSVGLENGQVLILNRHSAMREIWLAAPTGGFHFRYEAGRWLNTRDGTELLGTLEHLLMQSSGTPVQLS